MVIPPSAFEHDAVGAFLPKNDERGVQVSDDRFSSRRGRWAGTRQRHRCLTGELRGDADPTSSTIRPRSSVQKRENDAVWSIALDVCRLRTLS